MVCSRAANIRIASNSRSTPAKSTPSKLLASVMPSIIVLILPAILLTASTRTGAFFAIPRANVSGSARPASVRSDRGPVFALDPGSRSRRFCAIRRAASIASLKAPMIPSANARTIAAPRSAAPPARPPRMPSISPRRLLNASMARCLSWPTTSSTLLRSRVNASTTAVTRRCTSSAARSPSCVNQRTIPLTMSGTIDPPTN